MVGPTDSRPQDQGAVDEGIPRWTSGARREGAQGGAQEADPWRRYHCPVCGHQDRVTLAGASSRIECSHCNTPLVVWLETPSSERVTVRVDLELPRS